ncbi:AMP-binding protein, partial [Bacillus sp. S1-R2T1-FB]|uniref:AMP-binding protein n=1 Tax=Bacillus sp. S1-R2T1-FB TaxID=1973493 RepID=UPI0011551AD5
YDGVTTYREFDDQIQRLAGYLQQDCGVARGDRVLLYMQNSPQFIVVYYAILRAAAVVVPANPMNMTAELRHYVSNAQAQVAFVSQELYAQIQPLLNEGRQSAQDLQHAIVATYSNYLEAPTDLRGPDVITTSNPVSSTNIRAHETRTTHVGRPHLDNKKD